ncbi:MAG: tetratricopeptide repeat protein, partial [Chitinivibrionales bacterium]|nr:tetratricopeptide repeat protein [Chitinivibrionales bacterium]
LITTLLVIAIPGFGGTFFHGLDLLGDVDCLPAQITETSDEAYAKNSEGLIALAAQDYTKAMSCFAEALVMEPFSMDAKNNQGVVKLRMGDRTAAKSIWQEIVNQEPGYAIARYNLGVIAYNSQDYGAARTACAEALQKRKNFIECRALQSRIDLKQGDVKSAVKALAALHKTSAENFLVWSTYALALIQSGDTAACHKIVAQQEKSSFAYHLQALLALQKGNFDEALSFSTTAIRLGGPVSLQVKMADAFIEKGSFSHALRAMQSYFTAVKEPSADAWLFAGIAAKECNKNSLAKDYFLKGSTQFPNDQLLLFNLGYVYFYEKEYAKAETTWSSLAEAERDASLLYHRALAARASGDLSKAQYLITKALTLDQRGAYYDLLGVILHQSGNDEEAVKQFKKALTIDPGSESSQLNLALVEKSPEALISLTTKVQAQLDTCSYDCEERALELSALYYQNKKTEQALAVLERVAVQKRPEKMYRYIVLYLNELQRPADAIALLEKAKESVVLEPQTEIQLIDCYVKGGYYGKAIKTIKELLPHWEGNPWRLYYQLGYMYFEQNNLEMARTNFEASLKAMNKNPAARGMLAYVYNKEGNSERAHSLWEQNLSDDPKNPTLWINLGLVLDEKGKYEEAVTAYEKAYTLDSSNKALCLNIGNAYAALNRHRDARAAYAPALHSSYRELALYNSFISCQKEYLKESRELLQMLENEFPASVYTQRAKAEMLLRKPDTTAAVALLESLSNKDAEDRSILAYLYIAQKKLQAAQQTIESLPKTNQWHATAQQLRASLSFTQGDYNAAYQIFEALHDTSFTISYNMALSAYNAKRYDETIRIAERFASSAEGKNRSNACRLVGNAYFALKQWDKALQLYVQLYGLDSQNPLVQYNLAVAYYNLNDIERSWKYYERARTMDSGLKNEDIEKKYMTHINKNVMVAPQDSVFLLYNNAVTLQNNGQDSIAEQMYHQILNKDRTHSLAWNNLGTIHAARSEYVKSEKCYKRAIEGKEKLVEAYANLVRIYIATKDLKNAHYWLFKGKTYYPDDTLMHAVEKEMEQAGHDSLSRKKL